MKTELSTKEWTELRKRIKRFIHSKDNQMSNEDVEDLTQNALEIGLCKSRKQYIDNMFRYSCSVANFCIKRLYKEMGRHAGGSPLTEEPETVDTFDVVSARERLSKVNALISGGKDLGSKHIFDLAESGLSVKEFCSDKQINHTSLSTQVVRVRRYLVQRGLY